MADAPVLRFDGTCKFCDRSVSFVMDRERQPSLELAAVQKLDGSSWNTRRSPPVKYRILAASDRADVDQQLVIPDSLLEVAPLGFVRTDRICSSHSVQRL